MSAPRRPRINAVLMGDKLVGKVRLMKATGSVTTNEPLESLRALNGTRWWNIGAQDEDEADDPNGPPIIPHEIVRTTLRKSLPKEVVGSDEDVNDSDDADNAEGAGASTLKATFSRDSPPVKVELRVRIAYGGDGQRLDHAFRGASVIGICYDVAKQETLTSVLEKWFPMAAYFAPHLPIVLIGVRLPRGRPITGRVENIPSRIVKQVCNRVGGVCIVECATRGDKAGQLAFETLAWVGNDYEQASKSIHTGISFSSPITSTDERSGSGCTIA